jgi:hydrogenase maturation protein HypF
MNLLGAPSRSSKRRGGPFHHPASRWLVSGSVEGVGFCDFVYRLAHEHRLRGWVRYSAGQVEIVAAGTVLQRQVFVRDLVQHAPAAERLRISRCEPLSAVVIKDFRVLAGDECQTDDSRG